MTISRRIEIAVVLIAAIAAVFVLTACGGSSAAAPSPSPSAVTGFTALSLTAACRLLRTDILANGGSPDRATLQRVIDYSIDGGLIVAVKAARRDLSASDGGMAMGFDLSLMHYACHSTGVQIPDPVSAS